MPLQSVDGIGPATEETAGITTVEQLADADAASLAEKTGVAESRLEAFVDRAGMGTAAPYASGSFGGIHVAPAVIPDLCGRRATGADDGMSAGAAALPAEK